MIACVKLESATGSWTRTFGVRGEYVTTQPPAVLDDDASRTTTPLPDLRAGGGA